MTVKDAAGACDALAKATIPAARIGEPTSGARVVTATYRPATADRPDPAGAGMIPATPDYCEVKVEIRPVDPAAPMINSQVNLPARWNGKKLQFGGSGYNGFLQTGVQPSRNAGPERPLPLTSGYMTAGTDSGHQLVQGGAGGEAAGDNPLARGNTYRWALNDEALTNFAYAAYKKTHDVAVRLALDFYRRRPAVSYYLGGSQGGREAMMMAQRYPRDFDGIVAIDPVMYFSGLQTFGNHLGGVLQSRPSGWLGTKWRLVADTVIAACDAADGIADRIVSDYAGCRTRAPAALAAKRCPDGGDTGAACFSDAQLAVVRAAYDGYVFPFPLANGVTRYAGFGFGSEGMARNWPVWIAGAKPPTAGPDAGNVSRMFELGAVYARYMIARDGAFDALAYDPARFADRVRQVSAMIDATDPDLSAFYKRGGKMILRADLGDHGQSPYAGLTYWDTVVKTLGRATVDRFFAAYVAPGLPHTSGGIDAGADYAPAYGVPGRVDLLTSLEDWVERGVAPPAQLTLVNRTPRPPYRVLVSKPMCRYGSWPRYVGATPDGGADARNYVCTGNAPSPAR